MNTSGQGSQDEIEVTVKIPKRLFDIFVGRFALGCGFGFGFGAVVSYVATTWLHLI